MLKSFMIWINHRKLLKLEWAAYVTHIGEMRNVYKIVGGNCERTRPLQGEGVDGNMLLKLI
jgi:hypothetical protein